MAWFRLHSDVLNDPKVQRLPIALRWHWIELLCLANDHSPRGYLPAVCDIAFALRISEKQCERIVADLINVGLLDTGGECLRPHNWDKRQFASDARETPGRLAADSRRELGVTARRKGAADSPPHGGDFGVTDTDTEQKQIRTETETETDRGPPLPRLFEQAFGRPVTPMDVEELRALEEEHPRRAIDYALREAADANARNLRYVKSVLVKQKARGYDCKSGGASSGKSAAESHSEGVASRVRRLVEQQSGIPGG